VTEQISTQRTTHFIVLERYYYSSIAYQGYGLGIDPKFIRLLSERVVKGIEPERVLLLDLDPETARSRMRKKEGDRIEVRDEEFFQRVREGYLLQAKERPELFRIVDALGTEEEVHVRILRALDDLL
jgi:dTMP kinase